MGTAETVWDHKGEADRTGGGTGHDSIYLGLEAMKEFTGQQDIILIHDGVRPLINEELITLNIETVKNMAMP